MKRWLTRYQPMITLAVFLGFLSMGAAPSDDLPERDYEIHFVGPISDAGEKYLIEGLIYQDPSIQFWIDRPTQSALARTQVSIDRAVLQTTIAPSDLIIGYMGILHQDVAMQQKGADHGFPEYIDTGHPLIDQANYLKAKADWFAGHTVKANTATDQ
ncbi:MAG: hypothetical protein KA230_09060 [Flavobacteriales bacterium]|nr:hypothetical protein [Flavobacteriales bacterium]MBP6574587.1 hypothetical protein [Flavobacteriales bacterium]